MNMRVVHLCKRMAVGLGCLCAGVWPHEGVAGEMVSQRVRLSYTSPERCLQMLQLYGVSVAEVGRPINDSQLPTVVRQPSTKSNQILPQIGKEFGPTDSDPIGDLLVFYDESKPQQLGRVQRIIQRDIDLPARQIMLEAMVLEISKTSVDRLGIQWSRDISSGDVQLGDVSSGLGDLAGQLSVNVNNLFYDFNVKLRALIREGEAEIMSHPSVLTLDNRMAYIDVSDLVPVPKSRYHGNQAVQTVDFEDKKVGIQLAIRPRINGDGAEVSLQVNAVVSSVVAGKEVEVKRNNEVIASSPLISTREVKTYARIANNTPFIIGGLIARDDANIRDRVPVLSSIPVLGKLFRSEGVSRDKREVIIVITPFVLPEARGAQSEQLVGRNLPPDEDHFDSFGNRLFRNAYRIRKDDVYDLKFLTANHELRRLQQLADQAVAENVTLAARYPYNRFIDGRVPGEEALVRRQIYSVICRIGIDRRVDVDRLFFFRKTLEKATRFEMMSLTQFLRAEAELIWSEEHPEQSYPAEGLDFWDVLGDRAVALVYTDRKKDSDPAQIMFEQVPEIRLLPCKNREAYDQLLWQYNQPDEQGRERHTILLNSERDLQRVKQAVALRETIDLNGAADFLRLDKFSTGRLLLLPDQNDRQMDLISGRIARLFLATECYYDLLQKSLEIDMDALRKVLQSHFE